MLKITFKWKRLSHIQRPGSRAGITQGGALNSQIAVPDRPVTQQGLGGMGTGIRGNLIHTGYWY